MKSNNEIELLINSNNAVEIDADMEFVSEYGAVYQFGDGEYDNQPEWEFGCEVSMESLIDMMREEESWVLFQLNMGK